MFIITQTEHLRINVLYCLCTKSSVLQVLGHKFSKTTDLKIVKRIEPAFNKRCHSTPIEDLRGRWNIYMAERLINLLYGPYESHGIIKHRVQRLHGLIDYLNVHNYTIEVIQTDRFNNLSVEINERIIFTCDLRNLGFNMSHEYDVVCQRIIAAIESNQDLFCGPGNYPKIHLGKRWMKARTLGLLGFEKESLSGYTIDKYLMSHDEKFRPREEYWNYDICKYSRYGPGSMDLTLSTTNLTITSDKLDTKSSDFLDDYTVCQDGPCDPICPPPSEVVSAESIDESIMETVSSKKSVGSLKTIASMKTVSITKSVEKIVDSDKEIRIIYSERGEHTSDKDSDRDSVEFYSNSEGLYLCKECNQCFCICK